MLFQHIFCLYCLLIYSQQLVYVNVAQQRAWNRIGDQAEHSSDSYKADYYAQQESEYLFGEEEDVKNLFLGMFVLARQGLAP